MRTFEQFILEKKETKLKRYDIIDPYFKHEYSGGPSYDKNRIPILSLYWNTPDVWIKKPDTITKELQNLIDQE